MLRIDEKAKTLVAPDAVELVPDEPPSRDELHALISAGWSAFATEIGLAHVHAVAPNPAPGIDLLAVNTYDGRPVIVTVADGHAADHIGPMLAAAATVGSWDGDRLGAMHESLRAHPSPRLVLVGAAYDEGATIVLDYLVHHGVEVVGYSVECSKRGTERMMTVIQSYPAETAALPEPDFVAALEPADSAPPPPPPPPGEIPTAPPAETTA